jgi:hypothetical protein
MPLVPGRDVILIGTASLHLPRHQTLSGPMVVTRTGLTYVAGFHTDAFDAVRPRATSVGAAVAHVRASVADVRAAHASLKDLGAVRQHATDLVAQADTVEALDAALDAWAADDGRVLRLPQAAMATLSTGFFSGLKITLHDGSGYHFRSGKHSAIRDLLGVGRAG